MPVILMLLAGLSGPLICSAQKFEIQLSEHSARGSETLITADDPSCWYTGRTRINADGSRSFDWEGTQLWVNLQGASYAKILVNVTGNMVGRFSIEANGVEVSLIAVGGCDTPGVCDSSETTEFLVAQDLKGNTTIRVISILEPAFGNAGPTSTLTFLGWKTDGKAGPAGPRRRRKIELVGDSISAGYGSRGDAALHAANVCPVNQNTCGNKYTYNWKIAEHFQADIVPIAWSGKGMYRNCCDM